MNKYVEYIWNLMILHREKKQKRGQGKPAVLLICRQPIGDTLLASPLIRGMKRIYPEHHMILIASETNYSLLEKCPYADEVLVYEAKVQGSYLKSHLKKARAFAEKYFQGWDFEAAVIPSTGMPSLPEAWLAYFSGAKRRISYSERFNAVMHDEFMGAYDKYFTETPYDDEIRHEVESNVALLNLIQPGEYEDGLELWLTEEDKTEARRLASEAGILEKGLKVAVNLATSEPARDWPVERYGEVCRSLREKFPGISFVLVGAGARARAYGEVFLDYVPEAYDLIGKTSLRQLMALLHEMDLYLGGDTGTLHIAAACHLSGVAVYRSADKLKNRLSMDAKLRYPWQCDIVPLTPEQAMPGCENGCSLDKPHCILQISEEQVLNVMQQEIGRRNR